jgi:hypothetical protein
MGHPTNGNKHSRKMLIFTDTNLKMRLIISNKSSKLFFKPNNHLDYFTTISVMGHLTKGEDSIENINF